MLPNSALLLSCSPSFLLLSFSKCNKDVFTLFNLRVSSLTEPGLHQNGSTAKEWSVMAAGKLKRIFYGRKCSKPMSVLVCYCTGANLSRLSKHIAVRIDNSPLVEKGLLHAHVRSVRRYWTVGKVSSTWLFRAVKVRVGALKKQKTRLRVQQSKQAILFRYIVKKVRRCLCGIAENSSSSSEVSPHGHAKIRS